MQGVLLHSLLQQWIERNKTRLMNIKWLFCRLVIFEKSRHKHAFIHSLPPKTQASSDLLHYQIRSLTGLEHLKFACLLNRTNIFSFKRSDYSHATPNVLGWFPYVQVTSHSNRFALFSVHSSLPWIDIGERTKMTCFEWCLCLEKTSIWCVKLFGTRRNGRALRKRPAWNLQSSSEETN